MENSILSLLKVLNIELPSICKFYLFIYFCLNLQETGMLQSMSSQRVGLVQPLNKEQMQFKGFFSLAPFSGQKQASFAAFSVVRLLFCFVFLSSSESKRLYLTLIPRLREIHRCVQISQVPPVDSSDYFIFTERKWKRVLEMHILSQVILVFVCVCVCVCVFNYGRLF